MECCETEGMREKRPRVEGRTLKDLKRNKREVGTIIAKDGVERGGYRLLDLNNGQRLTAST